MQVSCYIMKGTKRSKRKRHLTLRSKRLQLNLKTTSRILNKLGDRGNRSLRHMLMQFITLVPRPSKNFCTIFLFLIIHVLELPVMKYRKSIKRSQKLTLFMQCYCYREGKTENFLLMELVTKSPLFGKIVPSHLSLERNHGKSSERKNVISMRDF